MSRCRLCCLASVALVVFAFSVRGEDPSRTEAVEIIPASVDRVWEAFTTVEGIESWMAARAAIDLEVGGLMRTSYDPTSTLEDEATITSRILAFEPERMIAMKTIGVPTGFPFPDAIEGLWSVTYFEPLGPERTRVRVVGLGYGDDEQAQAMRAFFERGNPMLLRGLRDRYGDDDAAAGGDEAAGESGDDGTTATAERARIWSLLHRLADGEWLHEGTDPAGGVFRVRNVARLGPDGRSVVARGWLGNAEGMFDHAATLVWEDPETRAVRFLDVNERGAIARGAIELEDDSTLRWDWTARKRTAAGEGDGSAPVVTTTRFDVRMIFEADDPTRYRFRLDRLNADGTRTPMVDIDFERHDEAPARFVAGG